MVTAGAWLTVTALAPPHLSHPVKGSSTQRSAALSGATRAAVMLCRDCDKVKCETSGCE